MCQSTVSALKVEDLRVSDVPGLLIMLIGGDFVTETILLLRWVSCFDLVPVMRLTFGLQFAPLRTTIYWVMCKCLETIDHIADAVAVSTTWRVNQKGRPICVMSNGP